MNKSLVERMPGNNKDPIKKLQYACGHLTENGNLHARQNDRMMTSIVLPGIRAICGKFASAFVSGDSRNASAINVVKSMTVQGVVLFYYLLQNAINVVKSMTVQGMVLFYYLLQNAINVVKSMTVQGMVQFYYLLQNAINVVKSMTVQGMVLFYHLLQNQAKILGKDCKTTQGSILDYYSLPSNILSSRQRSLGRTSRLRRRASSITTHYPQIYLVPRIFVWYPLWVSFCTIK